MSDIKIQPSATGSATVTLTAPATGTARTVTLPDSTDTLAVNSDVTNKLPLAGGTLTGNLNIGSYTANSNADNLVIQEANDFTGITLAADNDQGSNIYFADPEDNNVGGITYNHSSNYMNFRVNGAEKLRVLSSGGLTFNGDTAAANALDDYEEGTWTPMLTDTSNNATMHSLNGGVYTKIGRVVHCTANVRNSGLGSVSGNLYLSGFPFTSANTNGNHGAGAVANSENMAITAGHAITLYYSKNSSSARFDIYDHSGGVTPLQASEWSSDGQASIQVTFSIA